MVQATTNFDKALEFTLRWEGGYSFDKDDPGGETKFGISKKSYPDVNIKDLTREQAAEIYNRDYWIPTGADHLPIDIACAIFDSAVNCGLARTLIWADGCTTALDLIRARELYYHDLAKRRPLMSKYLKGWLNRVNALRVFVGKLQQP